MTFTTAISTIIFCCLLFTGSICEAMHLVFMLIGLPVAIAAVKVISGREDQCPPWFHFDSNITISNAPEQFSHCVCSSVLPSEIRCHDYTSHLALGKCAFWINETGESHGNTVIGNCPYIFPEDLYEDLTIALPQDVGSLNSFLCSNLNRETGSRMCGRCANGTGPSVTSVGSECVKCSLVNVLYTTLLHYLPATIVFLLILLAQFNITSGPMTHYVLYCNAFVVYLQVPGGFSTYIALTQSNYRYTLRTLLVLDSVFSFDPLHFLSPPLCLSPHLEAIHLPYIEMLRTLYPFLLLLFAYAGIELYARDFQPVVFLWRPIQRYLFRVRRSWDPHASLVQAFATIFFISYVKILFLVSVSFNWIDFMDECGDIETRLRVTYIDPTVPVLHSKHIYLMACSVSVFCLIIVPPILVLLIYPTCVWTKLQNHLPPRINLAVKIFVSTLQGSYKDGMNGTRDYRAFSGGILAGIPLLMVIHYTSVSVGRNKYRSVVSWQIFIVFFIIQTVVIAVMRPHKSETANNVAVCLSALVGIGAAVHVFIAVYFTANSSIIISALIVLSLPHFVFYGYLVYRIGSRMEFKRRLRRLWHVDSTEMEEQAILNQA